MRASLIHLVTYHASDYETTIGLFNNIEDAVEALERFKKENQHLEYNHVFGCEIESYEVDKYMPEAE